MFPNSIFLFLVPTDKPFETILVSAEPAKQRFIIYDPQKGRRSEKFHNQVDILRPFVADYIDNFKITNNDDDS